MSSGWERLYMKLTLDYKQTRFYYSADGSSRTAIGPVLDAGRMSDEKVEAKRGGILLDQIFTGVFISVFASKI